MCSAGSSELYFPQRLEGHREQDVFRQRVAHAKALRWEIIQHLPAKHLYNVVGDASQDRGFLCQVMNTPVYWWVIVRISVLCMSFFPIKYFMSLYVWNRTSISLVLTISIKYRLTLNKMITYEGLIISLIKYIMYQLQK